MTPGVVVHLRSPPDAKIALFRSLFRGRDDAYAVRYESQATGRSGYAIACANEWVRGVCEKPRVRCSDCAHRRPLPVTDDVIRWHLSGHDDLGRECVVAVHPMLRDETCFFTVIDLARSDWQADARAILDVCQGLDVPAVIERSRSGARGHVWLFFEEAVPAALGRRLSSHLLTEAMERRPEIGLEAYDCLFPSQDTLPLNSLGGLLALPLQKGARALGNSVFLDEKFSPHADQWEFLGAVRRMSRRHVEEIVHAAEKRGRILGIGFAAVEDEPHSRWSTPVRFSRAVFEGPVPDRAEVVLSNQVRISKQGLSPGLRNRLIRLAAFPNPEFFAAQRMRLSTFGKPRIICSAEDTGEHLALPRGCLTAVTDLLSAAGTETVIRDERNGGLPLDVQFQGELRADQAVAAEALREHDTGVLAATTAFGKTVVASWLIARRGVNTLVLVHRRQLQEQWVERLSTFLGVPRKEIGRIGGGRKKRTGRLDVAVIQSLVRDGTVKELVREYGHVVVDECHHVSAGTFERVVRSATAKYVTGLSATLTRKDGRHPVIFMQCGPVRHRVDARAQAAERPFEHTVHVRPTDFRPSGPAPEDPREQFQEHYADLVRDDVRNERICRDVAASVREGRSPLVLTERNDHLDALASGLQLAAPHLIVLRGGQGRNAVREAMDRLASIPENEGRVVLSTGRYVGEGFDDPRLDTLFLTLPVSWHGTIAQYVGRLHRLHHGKQEVRVYDYADLNVPMLARMLDRRCAGYEAVGYRVLIPGSAVPGWPAGVLLPVDPHWKHTYSATVRRLARDGLDPPLAELFLQATGEDLRDRNGADRARSATEAFLYRRLETLPQTAGLFELNGALPIPFDDRGAMEVDLLCREWKVAIELDGDQHLGSAEAWRRDRRKDLLLQEAGYCVLRFLGADIGPNLDLVLDTILRTLSRRRSRA